MTAFLIALLVFAGLILYCICPNRGRQGLFGSFTKVFIAHRGFHSNPDIPENSLHAFRLAVEAGFGIELDIQLTSDDHLVVFHDETLERVCGDKRKLHELTLDELSGIRLFGTEEGIPLLRDVLDLIGGKVPLVAEIKSEGRYARTTELAESMLRSYEGEYCVESFHPLVLRQFRKLHPEILRGQLSTDFFREESKLSAPTKFLLTNLLLNFLSRPDFIAYDRKYLRQPFFRLCRRLFHPVCFAWTVKSPQQHKEAKTCCEAFIFDSFDPRKIIE